MQKCICSDNEVMVKNLSARCPSVVPYTKHIYNSATEPMDYAASCETTVLHREAVKHVDLGRSLKP